MIPSSVRQYIATNLEQWVDETVIETFKEQSSGMGSIWRDSMRFVRTGELSGYLEVSYKGRDGKEIAVFIEKDTKPHEIKAKFKPYLKFYWARIGRWFRGYRVRHPGTKGKHIVERTEELGLPKLADKIITETTRQFGERHGNN